MTRLSSAFLGLCVACACGLTAVPAGAVKPGAKPAAPPAAEAAEKAGDAAAGKGSGEVAKSGMFGPPSPLVSVPSATGAPESIEPAAGGVYDKDYVGDMQTYAAKKDDTFVRLGRANNLGYVEMRAANPGIDPWLPGEGTKIILPARHLLPDAPHKGIVINIPEMRVYAFTEPGAPPHTYAIGVGREGLNTPTATTTVVDKKEGPEWRPTPRMRQEDPTLPVVVPAGPENPLGTHAIYLGIPDIRIHGTNKPDGIGRRVSSGCIRLQPEGIIDLFGRIKVGMPVTIVDQPVKAGWVGNDLYMEAHPTIEQANQMEEEGAVSTYRLSEDDMRLILKAAGEAAGSLDWGAIREAVRERRGYPVLIARRSPDNG